MSVRAKILTSVCFASAAVLAAFVAGGSATVIEKRSQRMMQVAMEATAHSWVDVRTDGLQVILLGTAPSEAERFRAITRAGTVVDSSRIVDNTDVENSVAATPPDFSLEMLRNDDGISLIGFVPASMDRKALVAQLGAQQGVGTVTDMLETADYPEPTGWATALDFATSTIRTLPRAKISVDPGRVEVHAIADSPAEKTRIETGLVRRRPADLQLISEISAPRPVITPFTLRFLIDAGGARFDACSADTERARDRILAAARDAGVQGAQGCTIGMGTPTPRWADAVAMGLKALKDLGAGTITFADADVVLVAAPTVPAETYDKIVGELQSNLPDIFSLRAERQAPPQADGAKPVFTALLSKDGKVELRGRVTNPRSRDALESYARARFGAEAIYAATLLDGDLPQGWPVRTMAALEALDTLSMGSVTVTPDLVRVNGVTGDQQASDTVSRLLAQRLGEGAAIALDIRYDRRLDPVLGLPTGSECVDRVNAVLTEHKITFEPGSAVIAADGKATLDDLAAAMKDCQDFSMEITGHTDSQGRDEMNLALSQERAQSVLTALRDRRVLTGNLLAKGYGETQPIADNGTEDGREANRRIEFVLLDAAPQSAETAPAPTTAESAVSEATPPSTPAVAPPAVAPPVVAPEDPDTGDDAPPMDALDDDAPAEQGPSPAGTAPPPAASTLPEQDPAIAIPVAPADDSPAKPEAKPIAIGIPD
ncbi:MAG TPA: OmpA family protein [Paenirhodobacter sp.]